MGRNLRLGQTALQGRAERMFIPLLVLLILAFCLQVVGFAAPGWIIIEIGAVKVNIGLWVVNYCLSDTCNTRSLDEVDTFNVVSSLTEFRVETVLALVFLLAALILCIFIRRPGKVQLITYLVIILAFLSGILALVASCRVGDDTRKAHDLLGSFSPFLFPYALFLTFLGGILALIACLVALIGIRPCIDESEPPQRYAMTSQPGYPAQPYNNQPYPEQSYPSYPYARQPYQQHPYEPQPYLLNAYQPQAYEPSYTVHSIPSHSYRDRRSYRY